MADAAGRKKQRHMLVVLSLAASAAAQRTEMGLYESMECGYAIIRALNANKSTKPLSGLLRESICNLHNTLMQINTFQGPGMTEEAINKCRAAASY